MPALSLFLIVAGAILQALFIRADYKHRPIPAAALKGAAAGIFVLLGILGALGHPDKGATLICLGLAFGMVGDILHALRFVRGKGLRSERSAKVVREHLFTIGALFFLAGHLCYLACLLPRTGASAWCAVLAGIVLAGVLAGALSRIVRLRGKRAWAGALYLACVCAMMSGAVMVWMEERSASSASFSLGAVLFLLSDTLLAINSFGPRKRADIRIWSLATYYAGQLLIAFSLWLV